MSKGELFFKKSVFRFIHFWLHWVFVAAHGLSLFVTRRDSSPVGVGSLLIAAALLIVEHRLRSSGAQA